MSKHPRWHQQGREQRQQDAERREIRRATRTPGDQLSVLDGRLGGWPKGATKERTRLFIGSSRNGHIIRGLTEAAIALAELR